MCGLISYLGKTSAGNMKRMWQVVVSVLTLLAFASCLTVGPVSLVNNHRFINYTKGVSPYNSLLRCEHELDGVEFVQEVSWQFQVKGNVEGTYIWQSSGERGTATGKLQGAVSLTRGDGSLELTELRYDLSGEYSCSVKLLSGERQGTEPWEVLIVDTATHLSILHTHISDCTYTATYSTGPVFPEPVVRGGLYSPDAGGFYDEISKETWHSQMHDNGSVTYSFTNVTFQLNSQTPEDIGFYVSVGVMKADGNFIPVSSAMDKNLIIHHLGCPEPRLETYQHISYQRDTLTCRGEHKDTEALVSCKEGYHSDGQVEEVFVRCDEETHSWVLQDGQLARREHLQCVINKASSLAPASAVLLVLPIILLRLWVHY